MFFPAAQVGGFYDADHIRSLQAGYIQGCTLQDRLVEIVIKGHVISRKNPVFTHHFPMLNHRIDLCAGG